MKKLFILITALILFLSVSSVGAGLFGPDTVESKQFSIEIPEGYEESGEWSNNLFQDFVYVWSKDKNPERDLMVWEVSSFDSFNRSNNEQIIDSYKEDGITIYKCYNPNEIVVFTDGRDKVYGDNYTHAEFDKDGHHFIIKNQFKGKYEDIDLKKDIELVKQVRDTIKHK